MTKLDNLLSLVSNDMEGVNKVLFSSFDEDVQLIANVTHHIIASGGKRIRPALTIACAKLCGYAGKKHIPLASAVELIHTATLLHDDVVDESSMRRGDKTANIIWGNQASILVGDFLLSKAFQLMTASGSLAVLEILSNASADISKGEVAQLEAINNPSISRELYFKVINAKTATLFAAASEIGAVVADAPEYRKNLHDFGLYLGIAFQLIDDALDYGATPAKFGKSIGDDFKEGKATLPIIIAFTESNSEEKEFWQRTISDLEQREGDFERALIIIKRHKAIEKTIELTEEYCNKAKICLSIFPETPAKQALIEIVDFCLGREF